MRMYVVVEYEVHHKNQVHRILFSSWECCLYANKQHYTQTAALLGTKPMMMKGVNEDIMMRSDDTTAHPTQIAVVQAGPSLHHCLSN